MSFESWTVTGPTSFTFLIQTKLIWMNKNLSYCSCGNWLLMSFSFMLLSGSRVLVFVQCPVPWCWEKVSDFFCWQRNRAQLAGKARHWWSETVSRSEQLFHMLGWHAEYRTGSLSPAGQTNSYLAEVLCLPLGLKWYTYLYRTDILTMVRDKRQW